MIDKLRLRFDVCSNSLDKIASTKFFVLQHSGSGCNRNDNQVLKNGNCQRIVEFGVSATTTSEFNGILNGLFKRCQITLPHSGTTLRLLF